MNPPKRVKGSNADLAMTGPQVRALLKAAGITAAEAARRLDRTPNTLTSWTTKGCDMTAARALAALAAGLPIWAEEKSQAFKALQGLAPALNLID